MSTVTGAAVHVLHVAQLLSAIPRLHDEHHEDRAGMRPTAARPQGPHAGAQRAPRPMALSIYLQPRAMPGQMTCRRRSWTELEPVTGVGSQNDVCARVLDADAFEENAG